MTRYYTKNTKVYKYNEPRKSKKFKPMQTSVTSFSMHISNIGTSMKKVQRQIARAKATKTTDNKRLQSAINNVDNAIREAKAYHVKIERPPIKSVSDFTNRNEFNAYIRSLNNYANNNRFVADSKGRVHNIKVIENYNKAVERENQIKEDIKQGILGKPKTYGGNPIIIKGNYKTQGQTEKVKEIDLRLQGLSTLTTGSSFYNMDIKDYNDKQIAEKTKAFNRFSREYSALSEKNTRYKKNMIKALVKNYEDGVLTKDELNEITNILKGMTTAEVMEWQATEQVSSFTWEYVTDEESYNQLTSTKNLMIQSLRAFNK